MKNTKYMFAYNNGKSTARVCTDLKQKEFETYELSDESVLLNELSEIDPLV